MTSVTASYQTHVCAARAEIEPRESGDWTDSVEGRLDVRGVVTVKLIVERNGA